MRKLNVEMHQLEGEHMNSHISHTAIIGSPRWLDFDSIWWIALFDGVPSSDDTLNNDYVNDIKLIWHLAQISSPVALNCHRTVFFLSHLETSAYTSVPCLDCNDTWKSIHCSINSKMHPDDTLSYCDAVQVFKYMHSGKITTNNPLNLNSTIVIVLQTISCIPATKYCLDLNNRPNCFDDLKKYELHGMKWCMRHTTQSTNQFPSLVLQAIF